MTFYVYMMEIMESLIFQLSAFILSQPVSRHTQGWLSSNIFGTVSPDSATGGSKAESRPRLNALEPNSAQPAAQQTTENARYFVLRRRC